MADRKTLGIVEDENLFLCDLNEDNLPNLIFKDDIERDRIYLKNDEGIWEVNYL